MRVTLGLIQMTCSQSVTDNFDKAVTRIRRAAGEGANVICTQELFRSVYFPQAENPEYFKFAESLDEANPSIRELRRLAKDLEVVIIASLFEKAASGLYYNTAVVLDADGKNLGKYRKMHIPEYPLFHEKFFFTPGDSGYHVFKTRYADIGVLICMDQWYPEAARLTRMKGAQIIFYPTAIGPTTYDRERVDASIEAWEIVQRGHAVANGCFVATTNRVGYEAHPDGSDGIEFWGRSFVADPLGGIVRRASRDREEVLLCAIDLPLPDEMSKSFATYIRDRRVDSYAGLLQRFQG